MINKKRGQSAFEFVMLLGFALLFVLVVFYFLQNALLDLQQSKNREEMKQVVNILTTEISLAEASPTQYTRTFDLPLSIRGNTYDIKSPDGREIVVNYMGEQYVYFITGQPLMNYTNLGPGENSIRKRCINQEECLIELYTPTTATETWWNAQYKNRKEITINNTATSSLLNYPAFLIIPKSTNMQPDFSDLKFINGDCNNTADIVLPHETESYTSGNAFVWVKLPALVPGENRVCMYYNNPGPFPRQDTTAVWDDNYVLVQHFEENSTTVSDSTHNNNDGFRGEGNGANMPQWEEGLSPETLRTPTCDNISSFGASSGGTITIDSGRVKMTATSLGAGGLYHLGLSGNDQYYKIGDEILMSIDIDFAQSGITSASAACYTTGVSPYQQITDTKLIHQGANIVKLTVQSNPVSTVTCRIWAAGMVGSSYFTVDNWYAKKIENKLAGSYNYDGVNDYIDYGDDTTLNISGPITIQLWFKIPGDPSIYDKNWYIFGKGSGLSGATSTGAYVLSLYKGNNKLYFDIDNGTTRTALISSTYSWSNKWYYLGVNWDGTKNTNSVKMYLDGTLDAQRTSGIDFLRTDVPSLRSGYRNLNYFNGSMDEIRVSNISRTEDWIKQDYQLVENQDTLVQFGEEETNIQ